MVEAGPILAAAFVSRRSGRRGGAVPLADPDRGGWHRCPRRTAAFRLDSIAGIESRGQRGDRGRYGRNVRAGLTCSPASSPTSARWSRSSRARRGWRGSRSPAAMIPTPSRSAPRSPAAACASRWSRAAGTATAAWFAVDAAAETLRRHHGRATGSAAPASTSNARSRSATSSAATSSPAMPTASPR